MEGAKQDSRYLALGADSLPTARHPLSRWGFPGRSGGGGSSSSDQEPANMQREL